MRIRPKLDQADNGYTLLVKSSAAINSRLDIGHNMRSRISKILRQISAGNKIFLLYQASLPAHWQQELAKSISDEGFELQSLILDEGEACKSASELFRIWSALQTMGFSRNDCIVAIGGGAVTDIAGFAASTYLRGTKLVLIPTTLLAQVDAAIGGKTGINLDSGKNLAGSFYFPDAVIVDPDYLKTLEQKELKSGMGEIIKYALIENTITKETEYERGPTSLLEVLESNFTGQINTDNPALLPVIACCVRMKLAVVVSDPKEERLRRCLNLGHTLGHALEKVSNYQLSHGEAVASGCIFALKIAHKRNYISKDEIQRIKDYLDSLNIQWRYAQSLEKTKLLETMFHDKKRQGSSIKFVLPKNSLGNVDIDLSLEFDELGDCLDFIE